MASDEPGKSRKEGDEERRAEARGRRPRASLSIPHATGVGKGASPQKLAKLALCRPRTPGGETAPACRLVGFAFATRARE